VEWLGTYLAIDSTLCTIGEGKGTGSGRIKLNFGTVQTAITIYNSGTRVETGIPCILLKGTHAANTLSVVKGDVGVAFFAGELATIATLKVGYVDSVLGDASVICGAGVTLTTVIQTGGKLDIDTTTAAITTITIDAGELTLRGDAANDVTTINLNGGVLIDKGSTSGVIVTLKGKGTYDHSQSMTARTITNVVLYKGARYLDPHGVVTEENGIDLYQCTEAQVEVVKPAHRTITYSAID